MPKTLTILLSASALFTLPALATADCDKTAERTAQLDAAGITKVVVQAGAGELRVRGEHGRTKLEANGKACARTQALLDQVKLLSRREGNTLYLETVFPEDSWGNTSMDLAVALPDNVEANFEDSSGDFTLQNIRAAVVADSSGDLEIADIAGDLEVTDSSGDLRIERIAGTLTVTDSSGDMELTEISGTVRIPVDSSGSITIEKAAAVEIQTDSSGDIEISQVQGDVSIDNDSSGDIEVRQVGGKFTVRNDSSGKIRQERVAGAVSLPRR